MKYIFIVIIIVLNTQKIYSNDRDSCLDKVYTLVTDIQRYYDETNNKQENLYSLVKSHGNLVRYCLEIKTIEGDKEFLWLMFWNYYDLAIICYKENQFLRSYIFIKNSSYYFDDIISNKSIYKEFVFEYLTNYLVILDQIDTNVFLQKNGDKDLKFILDVANKHIKINSEKYNKIKAKIVQKQNY